MTSPINDATCVNMYLTAQAAAKRLGWEVLVDPHAFTINTAGDNRIFVSPDIVAVVNYLEGYEKCLKEVREL